MTYYDTFYHVTIMQAYLKISDSKLHIKGRD